MKSRAHIAALALAMLCTACGRQALVPDPSFNRTVSFEIGAPNFDMEAVAAIENGLSGIHLYLAIPHASLVFVRQGDGFQAVFDVVETLRVGERTVEQTVRTDTVFVTTYAETQDFKPLLYDRRIAASPGSFIIEVAIEDRSSRVRSIRAQRIDIPDPASDEPALGTLLMEAARSGNAFEPVVSLHLPQNYDALRITTNLHNAVENVLASLYLVRFATDTLSAEPPFWFTPRPFTLTYMGVNYDEADTIQVSRRRIRDAADHVAIEFDLSDLEKGTYAAIVDVDGRSARRRYFTIKGASFPRLSGLEEMIRALAYIARGDEIEHMLAARSPEEMRSRFDAFWAERVPNKRAAASLLEAYYSRVEEANLLYSNYKAGWKTDRGMVYIVMGPPSFVEGFTINRSWNYYERSALFNRRLPPFVFRRSTAFGVTGLFDNYILQRSPVYEDSWMRRVERWRDGTML